MTLVNYGKLIFQEKPTFLCEILKIDAPKDLENSKKFEKFICSFTKTQYKSTTKHLLLSRSKTLEFTQIFSRNL